MKVSKFKNLVEMSDLPMWFEHGTLPYITENFLEWHIKCRGTSKRDYAKEYLVELATRWHGWLGHKEYVDRNLK